MTVKSILLQLALATVLNAQTDWPVYGHDDGGMRYSTLKQINASGGTSLVQVAFNETVCTNASYAPTDWVVTVNGNPATVSEVRRPQGTDLTTAGNTRLLITWPRTSRR